jgi:uncharacterized membrane protein
MTLTIEELEKKHEQLNSENRLDNNESNRRIETFSIVLIFLFGVFCGGLIVWLISIL